MLQEIKERKAEKRLGRNGKKKMCCGVGAEDGQENKF